MRPKDNYEHAGGNGFGIMDNGAMYTLNTVDRHKALEILNDPFLWQDFSESYECAEFAEALKRAVYALAEKVAREAAQ